MKLYFSLKDNYREALVSLPAHFLRLHRHRFPLAVRQLRIRVRQVRHIHDNIASGRSVSGENVPVSDGNRRHDGDRQRHPSGPLVMLSFGSRQVGGVREDAFRREQTLNALELDAFRKA